MAILRVLKDGVELQSVDLSRAGKPLLVVGRSAESDVKLDDRSIGREHALLSINTKGLSIQKKSKFGKLVLNGADIAESTVKVGDVVAIADYLLRFESDEGGAQGGASGTSGGAIISSSGMTSPREEPGAAIDAGVSASEENLGEDIAIDIEPSKNNLISGVMDVSAPDELGGNGVVGGSEVSKAGSLRLDEFSQGLAATGAKDAGIHEASSNVVHLPFEAQGDDRTAVLPNTKVVSRLVFSPNAASVEDFVITKPEISIGRDPACDIVLADKKSSRLHLVIKRVGANFVAKDQGSVNGTYVNGVKITEQGLAGDDVLRIGETEFAFKATSQEYFEQQESFAAPVVTDDAGDSFNDAALGGVPTGQGAQDIQGVQGLEFDSGSNPISGAPTGAIPGMGGPPKKETLLEKFKRQPTPRKILIGGVVLLVLYFAMEEEPKKKETPKPQATAVASADASFNALPKERKEFVINTYNLALDLYKGQQFEKAIYEVKKLLEILPAGYKDALDIKKYAEKSLDVLKAADDERKRKEAEEKLRAEIEDLVRQAQTLVDQGKDAAAQDIFAKVFERDPDNPTILRLRQQLEDKEQKRKADLEAAREIEFKRKQLEILVREGRQLLKSGKYYEVIDKMAEAPIVFSGDAKLLGEAKHLISEARDALKNKILPFLEAGRKAMEEANFQVARDNFYKVLKIDQKHAAAKAGLAKIRAVLHDRAKRIYIDGLMLEGVSDYRAAKAKFHECLGVAMPDDRYFASCTRKFKRLEFIDRTTASDVMTAPAVPTDSGPAAQDPEKPSLPTPVDIESGGSEP